MTKQNRACETCALWVDAREGYTHGECHRRSPIPVIELSEDVGQWPATKPSDWCGEWEQRDGGTR